MKKNTRSILTLTLIALLGFCFSTLSYADKPTKEEVVAKVKEAAVLIAEKGEAAAFKVINDKESQFTWKGTYVFAIGFDGTMLARSFHTERVVGKNFLGWKDKSKPPKHPIQEMINLAKSAGEGWVDYMYPKPGGDPEVSFRKLGYVFKVPGHDMLVGAGIYE